MPALPHEYSDDELREAVSKYNWVINPYDMPWSDPHAMEEVYKQIFQHRIETLQRLRESPNRDNDIRWLKEFYRNNKIQFVIDWGVGFDPRRVADGLSSLTPFIPFPKQVAALEYFEWCLKNREDGLCEKSRDGGFTFMACLWSVAAWLFESGFVAGFGSRKEEYVDEKDNPKSIFWRIRKQIQHTPLEFLPSGFMERAHSLNMRIVNPENGSYLTGEAGDNIGRGDRTTLYFVDESAFLERPNLVDAALSATTNCRIDISTSNGPGTVFYQKIIGGDHPVFRLHWTEDPRKDDKWYALQKKKLDAVILAQEVDIDHHASSTDNWIDGTKVTRAAQVDSSSIFPIGPTILGVDAARMGDDEIVVTLRQQRLQYWQKTYRLKTGPELAGIIIDLCEAHPGPVDMIVIELDGPGVSAYDQLKMDETWGPKCRGIHTGAKLSDKRNFNVRARMYRKLGDWFEDEPVCIVNDRKLMAQLSATPYTYKDGKLLLQPKEVVKKKTGSSPDRSDALALTFAVECNTWGDSETSAADQDRNEIPRAAPVFNNQRRRRA